MLILLTADRVLLTFKDTVNSWLCFAYFQGSKLKRHFDEIYKKTELICLTRMKIKEGKEIFRLPIWKTYLADKLLFKKMKLYLTSLTSFISWGPVGLRPIWQYKQK